MIGLFRARVSTLRLVDISVFLVLVGLWFVLRGYRGIEHDALLYTGEALRTISPETFRRDIFFAFGSQGSFTLFPRAYAILIELIGLKAAAYSLTLLGKLLWMWACIALCRKALPSGGLLLALAAVVIQQSYYDVFGIFSYGEPFLTPRIYAEALVMAGLTACLRGRFLWALALASVGLLVHPLMVLSFVPIVFWMMYRAHPEYRKYILAVPGFGGALVLGLAVWGMAPFSGLLKSFDAEWWEVIIRRCPQLIFWLFEGGYWGHIVYTLVVLLLARRYLPGNFSTASFAVAGVTAAFLALWWLGTEIYRDVLIVQLQLWRCLWVTQVIACVALGGLLFRFWQEGGERRVLASFLLAGFFVDNWTTFVYPLVGLGLMLWLSRQHEVVRGKMIWKILSVVAFLMGTLPYLVSIRQGLVLETMFHPQWWEWGAWLYVSSSVLALVCLIYSKFRKGPWRRVGQFAALVAVCAAMVAWSSGYINSFLGGEQDANLEALRERIPAGALVASNFGVNWVWTGLGRANYGGFLPLAGAVFARPMAIDGWRRLLRLHDADMPDSILDWRDKDEYIVGSYIVGPKIEMLCADRLLDYLVLSGSYDGGEVFPLGKNSYASVFECDQLRKMVATAG